MKSSTPKIKSDDVYEVMLMYPDFNILARSFKVYKKFLLFFIIGFFTEILISREFDTYLLMASICILCLAFLYCFFLQKKILYKFRYHLSDDMVELLSIQISHPVSVLMVKRSDVRIILKQNFADLYPIWQIYFYYKGSLIISQRAVGGWTKEMFLEIEKIINYRQEMT